MSISDTSQPRLNLPMGILIDRQRPISFEFEGKTIQGFAGDSIASALLANNQYLLSRSFKYHRPRGVLTMAGQDANTLVQLPDAPNVLADRYPAKSGLSVLAQNYQGSLEKDSGSRIGPFSRFMPVGFYYRSFYKPKGVWKLWEPLIRKKAGLGVLNLNAVTEGYYDKAYLFCDFIVIGAGPAGLQASLTAAETGADVLLVEQDKYIGGALTWARFSVDSTQETQLLDKLHEQVLAHPRIRILQEATCNGWFKDNYIPVLQGKRMYKVRARHCVMAVGAYDQPVIFRNNDLPGVMLISAAQRLMRHYAVSPGRKAVILTCHDDGWFAALEMQEQGIDIAAVVDMRANAEGCRAVALLHSRGIKTCFGSTVYEAIADKKQQRICAVEIRKITGQGRVAEQGEQVDCDLLCMSGGYMPAWQLPCQAGGALTYQDASATFSLTQLPEGVALAGSVNGWQSLSSVMVDGEQAVYRLLAHQDLQQEAPVMAEIAPVANFSWPIFPHPQGKEFVDFDEDLQINDIVNATRHGYRDVQLVKRFSTVGMGPSQGRHSALPTARLVAQATDRTVSETGVTTARPPLCGEPLALLAGRQFDPYRQTPMHERHLALNAVMMPAGIWRRPAYYARGNTDKATLVGEEAMNVRENVGLIDVSTLGGLEIRGPDAAEFLNRLYTFSFSKQPVGRTRYAVMTNEQGVIIDDGVACRWAEDHFYVTATTSAVDRVYREMSQWNTRWRLDVDIANVTAAWSAVNIAGPNSRKVLEPLCTDLDISAEAFPYLACRQGTIAGIPARVLRVGFVGELGYEIHVPSRYGEQLWDILMDAGEGMNIRPFGVEAQRLLRLEKGHVIVGQDTDGMTHPLQAGMGWAVSRKKPFFIGQRAIAILEKQPAVRQLLAFRLPAGSVKPLEGQILLEGEEVSGNVTSCEYSPALKAIIGLAYSTNTGLGEGDILTIKVAGGERVKAKVVSLPFWDKENLRQEM